VGILSSGSCIGGVRILGNGSVRIRCCVVVDHMSGEPEELLDNATPAMGAPVEGEPEKPRNWKHDCEDWAMEGVACARCNPMASAFAEPKTNRQNQSVPETISIVAEPKGAREALEIDGLRNHIIALEQDARLPEDEYSHRIGFEQGWMASHENAPCGHARANWKDPNYGTPEYDGDERCEFCAALASQAPAHKTLIGKLHK